ncbi:hypothetical protein [Williamsia maris]|uniref:Emopamil binding protein n=1 Tax=Williamsia maris TaxID=72806 RepID=A0ABT1HB85_9NOCA|nr:hypothetical protein [Williamsia maris]MCP2175508.1 Emopamil binding protein [Williamsia maris]
MSYTFTEHNLTLPMTGRRKAIFVWAGMYANLNVLAWILIGFDLIPVQPTSDVIALVVILPTLFLPFIALLDNPGENRTRLQRGAEMVFLFFGMSVAIECFWEISWVVLNFTGTIHGATADDHWLWLWWMYGRADTRYLTNDAASMAIEICAASCGPIGLFGIYLLRSGRRIAGNWIAILYLWAMTFANLIFIAHVWYRGWEDIQGGWFGFWIVFIGWNLPWLIAPPFYVIPAAIRELKYLYELNLAKEMKAKGLDVVFEQIPAEPAEPMSAEPKRVTT